MVDKEIIDYMFEKMGGEAAVRQQYEKEKPVTVRVSLPSDLAWRVRAEAKKSNIRADDLVRSALLGHLATFEKGESPKSVSDKKKLEALKRRTSHAKPTRAEVEWREAMVVKFLAGRKGVRFYANQVDDAISELDSGQVSRVLSRLVKKGKIMRIGQKRGTKYWVSR